MSVACGEPTAALQAARRDPCATANPNCPEANPSDAPVVALKGVGPALAATLARLNIHRVKDLLLHLPHRYQDRTRLVPLKELRVGQECLAQGQVMDSRVTYGRRRSWMIALSDGEGTLRLRFFHFAARQVDALQPGRFLRCFGEVRNGPTGLEMAHPEYPRLRCAAGRSGGRPHPGLSRHQGLRPNAAAQLDRPTEGAGLAAGLRLAA